MACVNIVAGSPPRMLHDIPLPGSHVFAVVRFSGHDEAARFAQQQERIARAGIATAALSSSAASSTMAVTRMHAG